MIVVDTFQDEMYELAHVVLSNNFPWFYQSKSTSYKYPFFSHIVIPRYDSNTETGKINSEYFQEVKKILDLFCNKHGIHYEKILRVSFNLTFHIAKETNTDAHVDYKFPHKVILMYFTAGNGDTLIYDKQYVHSADSKDVIPTPFNLNVKHRITPEYGKVVCFDGSNYHANEFCSGDSRRIVCVICIQ